MNDKVELQSEHEERFQKATENLLEIQRRIAPFIRQRKIISNPTGGELWSTSIWLEFHIDKMKSCTTLR